MSLDHLCEEGLEELEDFKIPFSIIFFVFVFLTLPYMIHFNRNFHIYGIIARLFLRIYRIWTTVYDVILFWYTILYFNYNTKHIHEPLDSTQTRNQQIDSSTNQQILLESHLQVMETIRMIRQQVYFQ